MTSDLDRGRISLEVLDRKRIPVDAAFWHLDDDDVWQFNIHTSLVKNNSRKAVYRKIRDALMDEPRTLRLREITVLSSSSELLRLVRMAISTGGTGINDIRMSHTTINGAFIRDLLIYRT